MFVFHISGNAGDLYKNIVEAELNQVEQVKFLCYSLHKGKQAQSRIPPENLICYQLKSILRGPVLYLERLNKVADYICSILSEKPNLVYSHMLFSDGYIARKIKIKKDIPFVVAVRNTDMNLWFNWKLTWIRKAGYRTLEEAESVIFLSEQYREGLLRKLPQELSDKVSKKAIVLPNGIDSFWHNHSGAHRKKLVTNNIRLITVGRIEANKNQTIVKAAMDILRTKGYSVSYTVIGDIKDQKMARELSSDNQVRLVSYKSKEEQLAFYQESDIFVMPSIHETFGLVYVEAMSQGLPVIYTKGQGFDGQFPEGTVGYHVDCMNAEEIADAIVKIVKNYPDISENCLKGAKKFDWEEIVRAYLYK